MYIFWKVWPNIYLSLLLSPALTAWFVCFHWYQQITKRQPDSSLHRSAFYYSSLSVQLGNWKSLSVPILSFSSLSRKMSCEKYEKMLWQKFSEFRFCMMAPCRQRQWLSAQGRSQTVDGRGRQQLRAGRQEWRAAKLGLAINIWCRFWRGDKDKSWTWSYTLQRVSEDSSLRRRDNRMGNSSSNPPPEGEVRTIYLCVWITFYFKEILVHSFLLDADFDTCQVPLICPRKNVSNLFCCTFFYILISGYVPPTYWPEWQCPALSQSRRGSNDRGGP